MEHELGECQDGGLLGEFVRDTEAVSLSEFAHSHLNQHNLGPSVLLVGVHIYGLETRTRLMVDLSSKWLVS